MSALAQAKISLAKDQPKRWLTRGGWIAEIVLFRIQCKQPLLVLHFLNESDEDGELEQHSLDGKFLLSGDECDHDLVEPLKEKTK